MESLSGAKGRAVAALFLSTVIWGVSFPIIKVAVGEVDPILFVNMRFMIASLLVIAYLLAFHKPIRKLLSSKTLWILGITNGLGFVMEFFGLSLTTASKASLLVNVNVVFIAIFGSIMLKERLSNRAKLGIIIGLLGVFFITTGGDPSIFMSGPAMGDLIIFCGGIIWAFSMIYNKKAVTELNLSAMEVTESMTITSAITLLPFLVFSTFQINLNAFTFAALIYVAILCTLVAFYLFYKALTKLTVVNSGIIMLFEIVIAVTISAIFLGEGFPPLGVLGGILIGVSILLTT